jgi:hypothetical protein
MLSDIAWLRQFGDGNVTFVTYSLLDLRATLKAALAGPL